MRIPPKTIYIQPDPSPKASAAGSSNVETKSQEIDENEEPIGWPHDVGTVLEKLDDEDRKWFLFQLVLREPCFLNEARDGVPISVFSDWLDTGVVADGAAVTLAKDRENEPGIASSVQRKEEEGRDNGKGTRKEKETDPARNFDNPLHMAESSNSDLEPQSLPLASISALPIVIPREEWLITFAQIDALLADNRDDFLLNLATLSEPYYTFLLTFATQLQQARGRQEVHQVEDDIAKTAKFEFLHSFRVYGKVEARRSVAIKAMEAKQKQDSIYWDMVDPHHRDDSDADLTKAEVYACLDLDADMPKEREMTEAQVWVFMIETKMSSVIEMIANVGSSSFPDRYRSLRFLDLLRLGVVIARTQKLVRCHMGDIVEVLVRAILRIWEGSDEVEREWLKVDENVAWGVERVRVGLEEVDLYGEWVFVQSALGL